MPTDKQILIDLTSLTPESIGQLTKIQEEIVTDLEKSGKRIKGKPKQQLTNIFQQKDEKIDKKLEKLTKKLEFDNIDKKSKDGMLKKIFGDKTGAKNIIQMGLNPKGFIGGLLTKGVPGFGAAVAATAIIVSIIKKFDDLEKKFTDQINTKTRVDKSNENIARIQAGLDQNITTVSPGVYDPRDSYNTFNEFNINRSRIETDYTIRSTQGVE